MSASTEEKSEFVPFPLAVAERGVKGGNLLVKVDVFQAKYGTMVLLGFLIFRKISHFTKRTSAGSFCILK